MNVLIEDNEMARDLLNGLPGLFNRLITAFDVLGNDENHLPFLTFQVVVNAKNNVTKNETYKFCFYLNFPRNSRKELSSSCSSASFLIATVATRSSPIFLQKTIQPAEEKS